MINSLIDIFTRFPDQEACIEHLENVRWQGRTPTCPHCGSDRVARKADGHRVGRWNCHGCKSSFNALSGTIFQKTKAPLQKWFLAIALIISAKKSLSSCQLARDLDLTQQTAWYMQQRIRAQMASEETSLLHGIVEMDQTYVGGKPRRKWDGSAPNAKRGRGTDKTPVIGGVERGGRVVAQVTDSVAGKNVLHFVKQNVDVEASLLMTDEYAVYQNMLRIMPDAVINHTYRYADGPTHTNTIEGFWSLIKRAWYGSHHHYSRK